MLSGRGTVHSYSEVAQTPDGFEPPHLMALVRLDEGIVVAAQLTDVDPEDIEIGMPVEMVTRRIKDHGPHGLLVYGYKFRPSVSQRLAS
ncbi:MAG: Zn-ribbon domain-containing OB-fold protein [Gammaproteobacteria bacterium]